MCARALANVSVFFACVVCGRESLIQCVRILCLCVCVYICFYVCAYVYIYVYVYVYVHVYACVCVVISVSVGVCPRSSALVCVC